MLIGYSGAIMPGSLLTFTLEKSIKSGTKAGVLISIGHSLLELVLVILIFLGIGKYLGTPPAQLTVGIIGGTVLIFFGVNMVRDMYLGNISINFADKHDDKNGNILIGGALISASNPYFIVWWAAVGLGLIMSAYNKFGILGVVFFYLGHITSDITWYICVSALISKSKKFINLRIYKIVIIILGFCLIGFGASFIISSVKIIYPLFLRH
jgi:threonine/homoserine/homoserine lactone efflux protein